MDSAVRSSPDVIVDALLTEQRLPDPPDAWVHVDPFQRQDSAQRG